MKPRSAFCDKKNIRFGFTVSGRKNRAAEGEPEKESPLYRPRVAHDITLG